MRSELSDTQRLALLDVLPHPTQMDDAAVEGYTGINPEIQPELVARWLDDYAAAYAQIEFP